MSIDEILEMMDDMLDKAVNVPFSNKKSLIDVDKMRELIDEIRLNMPREIKQAHDLVNDRKSIINNAKNEAASIVARAEQVLSNLEQDSCDTNVIQTTPEKIDIKPIVKEPEIKSQLSLFE